MKKRSQLSGVIAAALCLCTVSLTLHAADDAPKKPQQQIPGLPPGVKIPGGIQIEVAPFAPNGKVPKGRKNKHYTKIMIKNGKRIMEIVDDNEVKIKIITDLKLEDKGPITVEATTPADPKTGKKAKTIVVNAKNLDDLKKKSKTAAEYYEEHTQRHGLTINGGGIQIGPSRGGWPASNDAKKLGENIDNATEKLKAAQKKLQKLIISGQSTPEQLQKIAAEIKAAQKELTESNDS